MSRTFPTLTIRSFLVVLTPLVTLACADAPSPTAPASVEVAADDPTLAGRGNGKGKGGGGGGGEDPAPIVDEMDPWNPAAWIPRDHVLGNSYLDPANVAQGPGTLLLTIPAGTRDGAEIRSADRLRYRSVEATMRTPLVAGSISALFFYELDPRRNDEIDIEIFNDGSRTILFTTWVAGRQTNHAQYTLPFDPSAAYHTYRIEWSPGRVAFLVDGVTYQVWTSGVPRDAMYLMSNLWWPVWLSGPPAASSESLEIDRIVY